MATYITISDLKWHSLVVFIENITYINTSTHVCIYLFQEENNNLNQTYYTY